MPAPPRHWLPLLWVGQLLSGIGDRLHLVALMWIAVEAVGERAGFVAAAGPAAQLLLGLFGGVYADRWDKRRAMLAADAIRAAAVATLAIAASFGELSLWHLAAVAGVIGAVEALFQSSLRASLPLLIGDPSELLRANAWFEMTNRLAAVLGPPLTGLLLAWLPIERFFAIDAATFAASGLAVLAVGRGLAWKAPPTLLPGARLHPLREIRGALALVLANTQVSWSLALAIVWNICGATAWTVGLPLLARDVLGGGAALYGYLIGAYGVGNVLCNVALAWRPFAQSMAWMFTGGLLWGIGTVVLGLAPSVPAALLACVFAALGGPLTDVIRAYLIQTEFPPDQVGKVYSLRIVVSRGSHGIGLLLAAPIFLWLDVRVAIAGAGALLAMVSLVALLGVRHQSRRDWSKRR